MQSKLKPPVSDEALATTDAAEAATLSLHQRVEALLLTAERALSSTRIGGTLDETGKAVEATVEHLNAEYESTGRVMRIHRVSGGWRLQTTADVAEVLHEAAARRTQHKLSQAALETLSVIAYRQPVMRAEVEAIRGVACGEMLRGLMERRLIRIAGRAEELGRPILYGTTPDFLRIFGLGSIDDLPDVEGLARVREATPRVTAADSEAPGDEPAVEEAVEPAQASSDVAEAEPAGLD